MEKVKIKDSKRLNSGHLWIFSNELYSNPKDFEPGSLVEVVDKKERFLGIGYINPHSLISIRLLTRRKEEINADFFRRRVEDAIEFRKRIMPSLDATRIIYSEADFLPGLIVDKYNDCLVVEILTLGMERLSNCIFDVLHETFKPSSIVLRNDSPSRILEGLELERKVLKGTEGQTQFIKEGDLIFEIDPLKGQKTGFFLDQKENRLSFRDYVDGGIGLDLFCYTGAFGLHLARKGAKVKGVDESGFAVEMGKRTVKLNGLEDLYEFVREDVFHFLRRMDKEKEKFDFIILDPPSFTRNKKEVKDAIRGYKEINRLAAKLLKRGGLLCTSSCSHHIDLYQFLDTVGDAIKDARRSARILEIRSQAKDHPILLSMPETAYLKCLFMEII